MWWIFNKTQEKIFIYSINSSMIQHFYLPSKKEFMLIFFFFIGENTWLKFGSKIMREIWYMSWCNIYNNYNRGMTSYWKKIISNSQACTNPTCQVTTAPKIFTTVPRIFCIILSWLCTFAYYYAAFPNLHRVVPIPSSTYSALANKSTWILFPFFLHILSYTIFVGSS
jgi:hypothetical protein